MKFCVDSKIMEVEKQELSVKQQQEKLLEELKKELDV